MWIAGDTGLFPEMAALPDLAGGPIDVAARAGLGVGTEALGGTHDPGDRRPGCRACGARFALPVHWGTLHPPFVTYFARSWLERPGHRFATAVAEQAPGCTAVVLAPGQSWVAPS